PLFLRPALRDNRSGWFSSDCCRSSVEVCAEKRRHCTHKPCGRAGANSEIVRLSVQSCAAARVASTFLRFEWHDVDHLHAGIDRIAFRARFFEALQIVLPHHILMLAELAQVFPGVDAGVVAIVEEQLDAVMADGFELGQFDEALTHLQHFLARAVTTHFGRRRMDTQKLGRQRETLAVLVIEFEHVAAFAQTKRRRLHGFPQRMKRLRSSLSARSPRWVFTKLPSTTTLLLPAAAMASAAKDTSSNSFS